MDIFNLIFEKCQGNVSFSCFNKSFNLEKPFIQCGYELLFAFPGPKRINSFYRYRSSKLDSKNVVLNLKIIITLEGEIIIFGFDMRK